MATDDDLELNPPKLVLQSNLDTCWACCMSALLDANMSPKRASEADLVKQYATTSTGGISPERLEAVARDFEYACVTNKDPPTARMFMSDSIIKLHLRSNGLMMLAWKITDPEKPTEVFFHAQIVWGVIYQTRQDIGTERAMIRTMNPGTKTYDWYPLFTIYRAEHLPLFGCWPKATAPSAQGGP